jgi:hypothetical protein
VPERTRWCVLRILVLHVSGHRVIFYLLAFLLTDFSGNDFLNCCNVLVMIASLDDHQDFNNMKRNFIGIQAYVASGIECLYEKMMKASEVLGKIFEHFSEMAFEMVIDYFLDTPKVIEGQRWSPLRKTTLREPSTIHPLMREFDGLQ